MSKLTFGAALLAASVVAQADELPKFYGGVGIGQSSLEADDYDLSSDDFGFKAFLRIEMDPTVAWEIEYLNGGEAKDQIAGQEVSAQTQGARGSLVYTFPIGATGLGVYAKGGLLYWKSEVEVSNSVSSLRTDDDGWALGLGAGLSWTGPKTLIRVEYSGANDLNGVDSRALSLDLAWRFK